MAQPTTLNGKFTSSDVNLRPAVHEWEPGPPKSFGGKGEADGELVSKGSYYHLQMSQGPRDATFYQHARTSFKLAHSIPSSR